MSTWEDIKAAAATIKTMPIKGKDYAQVPERVKAFRMVHPDGAIVTEIVSMEGTMIIMRATVSDADGRVLGTGTAFEERDSSYINKTSYIENCETSAVGRALGNCGFGIDTSICSAEELQNALAQQERQQKPEAPKPAPEQPARSADKPPQIAEIERFGHANGFNGASIANWRKRAIDNGIIPNKTWPEMTMEEIKTLETFIVKNAGK